MMDRSTQRELIKSLLQLNDVMRQIDFANDEQKTLVVDGLQAIIKKFQENFSEQKIIYYVEPLQGLENVILSTSWQSMEVDEDKQCVRLCRDIVLEIVNTLRKEKDIKKEIVFLPYKASMWDSLESVWKAAYEDKEHCNTYVIPIAYADRKPDGTPALWHCERDEYPDYVPVLDWHDYTWERLKKMHPDIIFIHNPYDNYNAVTSIDSQYYSDRLKKCTDKLVYIPYFVLQEPEKADEDIESKLANFVLTPGVFNADKTIVQSEVMRQIYIKILLRSTNIKERCYWEKHILGIGSPKIDKVVLSKCKNFDLPEKWKKLIEGKKVILYNTSLTAVLRNSDKVCNKLRIVLDTFRRRMDVILWWRPHPLMKATIRSLISECYRDYENIETQYVKDGWGIYDISAQLERAIACSDGYYGDCSSVLNLYEITNKPIMIENFLNTTGMDMDRIPVWMHDYCIVGDSLWFVHGTINALMKYSINNHKLTVERILENENIWQDAAFCGVQYYRNKIFLIPASGRRILVYDLNKKEERIIWETNSKCKQLFRKSYVKGNVLYAIPRDYDYILEIDMLTETVIKKVNWKEVAAKKISKDSIKHIWAVSWNNDDILVLALEGSNLCLIYDMRIGLIKGYFVGTNDNVYSAVACAGEYVFFWENKKRNIVKVSLIDMSYEQYKTNYPNCMIYAIGKELFVIESVDTGEFWIMNTDVQIVYHQLHNEREYNSTLYYPYHNGVWMENTIDGQHYYYDRNVFELNIYDSYFNSIKEKILLPKVESEKLRLELSLQASGKVHEMDLYQLEDWLNNTPKGNDISYKKDIGKAIYDKLVR